MTEHVRQIHAAALEHGGISAAARALGLSKQMVWKAVHEAEEAGLPKAPRATAGRRARPVNPQAMKALKDWIQAKQVYDHLTHLPVAIGGRRVA